MKKTFFALALITLVGCSPLQAQDDGWVNLFDGQTLQGWNNPYEWGEAKVVDSEIHLVANKKFFLCSEKTYSDFIFEAEIKMPEGKANSGIMFRCDVARQRELHRSRLGELDRVGDEVHQDLAQACRVGRNRSGH